MRLRLRATSLLLATAVATPACTTINPYTGEEETSSATAGAIIGAVAGAAIGAATGDNAKERRKRALIGAGAGAIAGGSVGYYMDVQEAKLRKQLQGSGVSVTRNGNNITLNMPGNVTFRTGSADLNPGFLEVLDSVGLVLDEYEKTLIVVAGHTDSVGSIENNQQLSERRSESVGTYLARKGVTGNRILAVGYGESQPVADNSSADGRARNRRVELTLEPLTE